MERAAGLIVFLLGMLLMLAPSASGEVQSGVQGRKGADQSETESAPSSDTAGKDKPNGVQEKKTASWPTPTKKSKNTARRRHQRARLGTKRAPAPTSVEQQIRDGQLQRPLGATEAATLLSNVRYLTPSFQGIGTDRKNSSRITSKKGWRRGRGGKCTNPVSLREVCNKVKALHEVLYRFSGNNDFFEKQCPQRCTGRNEVAVLTDFELADESKAKLTIFRKRGICRYQLSKEKEQSWLMLEIDKPTCLCLPDSC